MIVFVIQYFYYYYHKYTYINSYLTLKEINLKKSHVKAVIHIKITFFKTLTNQI